MQWLVTYPTILSSSEKDLIKKIEEESFSHKALADQDSDIDKFKGCLEKVKILPSYTIKGNYSKFTITEIAKKVIVDPILESYQVGNFPNAFYDKFDLALEIFKKPGVLNNLANTLKNGMKDFLKEKFDAKTEVQSSTWVFFSFQKNCSSISATKSNELKKEFVSEVAKKFFFNPLIEDIFITDLKENKDKKKEKLFPFRLRLSTSKLELNKNYLKSKINSEGYAQGDTQEQALYQEIPLITKKFSDTELEKMSQEKMFYLNLKEMKAVIKHYQSLKNQGQSQSLQSSLQPSLRSSLGLPINPTDVEMEIIAQTWSEHCKHKIFSAKITYYSETGKKPKVINSLYKTYIKKTTYDLQQKRSDLISVFSDNAGIVVFDKKYALAMKVETHNSPSALEPFGGAITGILGVNRDILGTGKGAMPLANTNVLCFADPDYDDKIPTNLLHPKKIFYGVHRGIEKGGNQSGIPTVNGSIVFDSSFMAKPLVFCGTLGILPRTINKKKTHLKKISAGDIIVMVGGRVGKDGIHGATFSSDSLTENTLGSVVQIGDSFTQKKMTDFLLEARDKDLYETLTDNGAGGLSSSVGEMATISGGANIYLDRVLLKYPNLKPWEIVISESQERMTLAIKPRHLGELEKLAALYDVEVCAIGEFSDSGNLKLLFNNKVVGLLSLDFLHNQVPQLELIARKPLQQANQQINLSGKIKGDMVKQIDLEKTFLKVIASKNIASKEKWVRQFDHEVKAKTILKPFDGANGEAVMNAGAIKPLPHSKKGIILSNGILPRYSRLNAYKMGEAVVDEAVRNFVASGGDPSRMYGLDNFCWPDPIKGPNTPDGEEKLAQLVETNKALRKILLAYNLPLISGKDSMKNDYGKGKNKLSVLPTLLFTLVGIIPDVRRVMTSHLKKTGTKLYLLGKTYAPLGASEVFNVLEITGGEIADMDYSYNFQLYEKVFKAIKERYILSCHDISDGGLAVTLGEMAWGGEVGAEIDLSKIKLKENTGKGKKREVNSKVTFDANFIKLFSESSGRFVVEVEEKNLEKFESLFTSKFYTPLGQTNSDKQLSIFDEDKKIFSHSLKKLKSIWKTGLKL